MVGTSLKFSDLDNKVSESKIRTDKEKSLEKKVDWKQWTNLKLSHNNPLGG